MKLKIYKPTSNSLRHLISIRKNLLSKNGRLLKYSLKGIKRCFGRSGRIVTGHIQRGCKKLYRNLHSLNMKKYAINIFSCYNPNTNSFCSVNYDLLESKFFNLILINNVCTGSLFVCNSLLTDLHLGYRTMLKNIPTGSIISNVSSLYNKTSIFIKSAGTFGQIIQKKSSFCKIKLPSSKIIELSNSCFCDIGVISNKQHNKIVIAKAGRNRLLGKRPTVRGIAMNPVDHPHGGQTKGGMHFVTPWGKPAKGSPTVKK